MFALERAPFNDDKDCWKYSCGVLRAYSTMRLCALSQQRKMKWSSEQQQRRHHATPSTYDRCSWNEVILWNIVFHVDVVRTEASFFSCPCFTVSNVFFCGSTEYMSYMSVLKMENINSKWKRIVISWHVCLSMWYIEQFAIEMKMSFSIWNICPRSVETFKAYASNIKLIKRHLLYTSLNSHA